MPHPEEAIMLRVLGRLTSINVRKVLWTMDELGIAYEREDWGKPIRDPNVPEFLRLNPNALVPVLIDGDFVLWESSAIMRYVAEGSTLIPADSRQCALMEQWLAWQQTTLGPTWSYTFLAYGRPTPGHDDPAQIAQSIARWTKKMTILDDELSDGRRFVVGDGLSLADIVLGVAVHRWLTTPFDKPALSAVERYYRSLKARPAAAPYLGDTTP
jgi:glutathione S-transferase